MANGRDVEITVICLIYNHEKYLEKCLEGFAEQKTDFPFEVILHDDCSTDGSSGIVRNYSEKYPDIFVPMIEETNQYSKGRAFVKKLIDEAKGRFIAMCEGDDYWCDPLKLQKQYNYMKEHEECSMCVHNTIIHDLSGNNPDKLFWDEKDIRNYEYLTEKHVFDSWLIHTTSYLFRNNYEIRPEWSLSYWSGDYVYLTVAYANGKIGVLHDVMSVYNWNNPDGVTVNNNNSAISIEKTRARSTYLEQYLKHFPEIDDNAKKVITDRIKAIEEYTAIDEFFMQMHDIVKDESKTEQEKFDWLVGKINEDSIFRYCTNPSEGMETNYSAVLSRKLFEMVDLFLNSLSDLKDNIHFSFVPWLTRVYLSGKLEKEFVLAIAAAPENSVGWGIKLSGDPNKRLETIRQYANPASISDADSAELNRLKNAAVEAFERGDLRISLDNVNKGLEISSLDQDLIYYKAFILLNLEDKKACLDEIGIYSLFYGIDEDIAVMYRDVCG